MSTFLKLLPMELSSIKDSDYIQPGATLGKDDQEVGKMSDLCKRLWTLGKSMEKEAMQHHLDSHYCNDKVKRSELQTKENELAAKSEVLKSLMWIAIKDELGLWGKGIGVRPEFKVVTMPDISDDIPPIIKRFLGQ